LKLEPQTVRHAEELFPLLSDPSLYAFLDSPPPESLEWLRERFRKLETRMSPDGTEQWLNWVIRMGSGQAAGFVQATIRAEGADLAFVVSRAHWGRGVARRAAEEMIEELRRSHGVTRVFATASRGNVRSIRLLKRLGLSAVEPAVYPRRKVASGDVLMTMELAPP
jgi:ribosomal-protein-alanine N-acetyltransferase